MDATLTFTTKDLVAHTGIDSNVLRALLNGRWITPDVAAEVGRGRSRLFSYTNLFEVALAGRLHHFNASSADIGAILRFLRAYDDTPDDASAEWLIMAELWARTRSFDAPVQTFLYWSGEGDQVAFGVGNVDVRQPPWGWNYLCIDLTKIVFDLLAATGLKWPLAEIRPLNDEVYLRVLEMDIALMKQRPELGRPEDRETVESLISDIKKAAGLDDGASQ